MCHTQPIAAAASAIGQTTNPPGGPGCYIGAPFEFRIICFILYFVHNTARACYIRLFLPVTNNIYVNGYRVDYVFESALPIVFGSATP